MFKEIVDTTTDIIVSQYLHMSTLCSGELKTWPPEGVAYFSLNIYIVKLQMTSPNEKLVVFQPNFTGMILGLSFLKLVK